MRARLLRDYYLATPIFLLVDLLAGSNVRVSGLEAYPALKYGYYFFCFAAGLWALKRPGRSEGVALVESAVNIFVLILSGTVLSVSFYGNPLLRRGRAP